MNRPPSLAAFTQELRDLSEAARLDLIEQLRDGSTKQEPGLQQAVQVSRIRQLLETLSHNPVAAAALLAAHYYTEPTP